MGVEIVSAGSCTTSASTDSADLPSYAFANIGGSGTAAPEATITWDMKESEDDISGDPGFIWFIDRIELADPGMDCDLGAQDATLVFTDDNNICDTVPEVTVRCVEGDDMIDFRSAYEYTFDSDTGILTDVASGNEALIDGNDNYSDEWSSVYFGPLFQDDDDKANLACDYDSDFVCMWKAWSELSNIYFYDSGPGSQRVSLVKDGEPIFFGTPKQLLYTHSGTESNSGRNYDGSTSFLVYDGPGQLYGFPQFCLNPITGDASSECYPEGSEDSTINGDDIGIAEGEILTDSFGNEYLALPGRIQEIYPVTSNTAICNDLTFDSFNLQAPSLADVYTESSNIYDSFPDDAEKAYYLEGGVPVVFGGVTQHERQVAAADAAAEEEESA